MAYCRFSSNGDVYLYPHSAGFIECYACLLAPTHIQNNSGLAELLELYPEQFPNLYTPEPVHDSVELNTRSEALAHLDLHRTAGHRVPEYAFEFLRNELMQLGEYVTPSLIDDDGYPSVDMGDRPDEATGD